MVGVVDIGTNSMRLLITSDTTEVGRWVEVTGLGQGVDSTGHFSPEGVEASLEVFEEFGRLMAAHDVGIRKAIATSASRDASDREEFFDRAELLLGVRPTLISGEEEARYAFSGATTGRMDRGEVVVSDIGGGSTEFVTESSAVSVDIGSVRLTDRVLADRPAPKAQLDAAFDLVRSLFAPVPVSTKPGAVIGIAGTWTSLAAISLGLPQYDREIVHGHRLDRESVDALVDRLGSLTLEETMAIPSLDPKRAPVILAGAVVAAGVLDHLSADVAGISESDTLDGVAAELHH